VDDDGDSHTPRDWVDKIKGIRKTGFWQLHRAHFLWIIYGDPVDET
jgi:hypothetical protein